MTLHESQIPVAESYCGQCLIEAIKSANENPEYVTIKEAGINEAEYQGRKVQLGNQCAAMLKNSKFTLEMPKATL